MTNVRFQADADLRQAIVTGVIRRQPDLDFRSAHEGVWRSYIRATDKYCIAAPEPYALFLFQQDLLISAARDRPSILMLNQLTPVFRKRLP